ncbi:Hypp3829 [Branchiostoma lanceolatum]|uniref:Hypp3829 protein n=1 Tax=Branchiostoma lanceolatum TaxID=7740 RepID=A0A8K0A845_BRALA|nr:Hypp3829 [Branchiostoma lanceolatum]
MPVFSRFKRPQTTDDVMAELPWSSAYIRRQRHPSVWTSTTSLTSLDVDEILASNQECWLFEEKGEGVSELQLENIELREALKKSIQEAEKVGGASELEDIELRQALEESMKEAEKVKGTNELEDIELRQALEESMKEAETTVERKTPSSREKNSVVVQAEVHVDAPSSKAESSPPNESFYQSLYKYHDPRSWEKEDAFYAYSSDEDEPGTSTSVAVVDVHHGYDSDVETHSIPELEENWWALLDVPIEVIQQRRRLMKNGCVYWDPLEITLLGSETITIPDPEESIATQKTKKPGAWKKFKRGLGRARRRLQKLFCGCLMEEEFDPDNLYVLEFKSRGIDVVVV